MTTSNNINAGVGCRRDKGSYENMVRSVLIVTELFDQLKSDWVKVGLTEEEAFNSAADGVQRLYPEIDKDNLRKVLFDHCYNRGPSSTPTEVTMASTKRVGP